jgi:hypothetical protein
MTNNAETPGSTPAITPDSTADGTGPGSENAVENGNDAFSAAFEAFASGNTPAPDTDKDDDGGDEDQAGQDDDAGNEDGAKPSDAAAEAKDPPSGASGDKPAAGEVDPSDPWANASPALLAEKLRLENALAAERHRANGASGRASGLHRELNALKATVEKPEPEAQPSEAKKALDDKIAQLKEDFPEIAGPLIELLEVQSAQITDLRGKVTPITEATEAEALQASFKALGAKHPDYQSYGDPSNPDYAPWLAQQPQKVREDNQAYRTWLADQAPGIQNLAKSWDPDDCGVVLSLFKTAKAEASLQARADTGGGKTDTATGDRRQRQLDGGREVRSKPLPASTGAPENDFDGAFNHFAKRHERKAG